MTTRKSHGVPTPATPVCAGDLPRTLCFALSARDRAAVLRVLRRYGTDRASSLKAALGVAEEREAGTRGG